MDIICISSIDWDFIWQGPQAVMARLAAGGHRVLYVENTGVRAPKLSDVGRWSQRIRNWRRGVKGFRQERENLFVYSPLLLPFPHSRLARRINRFLLARSLRRWMRAVDFRRPVLWTFLPTPLVLDLTAELDPALVVYYCLADFAQLTSRPALIRRSERRLLDRADVVFTQGDELRQKCLPHPNLTTVPMGVDLDAFPADAVVAPELDAIPRPRIGYIGGIHQHVDFRVLEHVARNVDGTVVLVGPAQIETPALRELPNVVFMGPQPHDRLCAFLKGFDVGLIPYVLSDYTRTVYPTKLNEYLAMGLPVVSTELPEVRRVSDVHGGLVSFAVGPQAFAEAVREALTSNRPCDADRRRQAAQQNSWEHRVRQMVGIVEHARAAREEDANGWQERLQRLYWTARRGAWQVAASAAAGALIAFYTPAIWLVASPLRVVDPVRPAQAIVVFAGGVGESGQAGGGYQERVKHAVDLYAQGMAPWLVFSSGYVFAFREADVMKTLAEANGVPGDAILLEQNATNTRENVLFVSEILKARGWDTILLVSSPYHLRRAELTWRRLSPETTVIAAPVPRSQFYEHNWGASLDQIRAVLHEYAAIAVYWAKGWI